MKVLPLGVFSEATTWIAEGDDLTLTYRLLSLNYPANWLQQVIALHESQKAWAHGLSQFFGEHCADDLDGMTDVGGRLKFVLIIQNQVTTTLRYLKGGWANIQSHSSQVSSGLGFVHSQLKALEALKIATEASLPLAA